MKQEKCHSENQHHCLSIPISVPLCPHVISRLCLWENWSGPTDGNFRQILKTGMSVNHWSFIDVCEWGKLLYILMQTVPYALTSDIKIQIWKGRPWLILSKWTFCHFGVIMDKNECLHIQLSIWSRLWGRCFKAKLSWSCLELKLNTFGKSWLSSVTIGCLQGMPTHPCPS